MIFYVSFRDILSLPQFEGWTPTSLLDRKNDSTILNMFHPFGADKQKPLIVQAAKHRTKSNKIVVDFRYVFEERTDKEWINSSRCSLETRINRHKADTTLIGLLSQMGDMHRTSRDNVCAIGDAMRAVAQKKSRVQLVIPTDWDEDMEATIQLILTLHQVQKHIRGEHLLADENVLFDYYPSAEVLKEDSLQDDINNKYEENK